MLFDDFSKILERDGFFAHHREVDFVPVNVLRITINQPLERILIVTNVYL